MLFQIINFLLLQSGRLCICDRRKSITFYNQTFFFLLCRIHPLVNSLKNSSEYAKILWHRIPSRLQCIIIVYLPQTV